MKNKLYKHGKNKRKILLEKIRILFTVSFALALAFIVPLAIVGNTTLMLINDNSTLINNQVENKNNQECDYCL